MPDDTTPSTDARLSEIEGRLDRGSPRMDELSDAISENTRITEEGNHVIAEVREMLAAGKTVVKVLNWIGRAALKTLVWAGKIAGAAVAIYAAFYAITHGGQPPPK